MKMEKRNIGIRFSSSFDSYSFFFSFFFSSISVRSMRQCFPDRFRNLIIGLEQSNIEQSREESILDRTERQTSRVIEKWKKKGNNVRILILEEKISEETCRRILPDR